MYKKIVSKIKSKSGIEALWLSIMTIVVMIVAFIVIISSLVCDAILPEFENEINNEICEMEDYKLSKEQVIEKVSKLTNKKRSVLFSTIKCTDASVDLIYKEDDSRTYRVTYKIDDHSRFNKIHSKNIVIKEDKNSQD